MKYKSGGKEKWSIGRYSTKYGGKQMELTERKETYED